MVKNHVLPEMSEAVTSPLVSQMSIFFYEKMRKGLNFHTLQSVYRFLPYRRQNLKITEKSGVLAKFGHFGQKWPKMAQNGPKTPVRPQKSQLEKPSKFVESG